MNNPLDRRMFNQQMMNRQPMPTQPRMGGQPMGILNSSPQLMNAVQGYAQGGMVKGYNHGGAHFGDARDRSGINTIYGQPEVNFNSPLFRGIAGQANKEAELEKIRLAQIESMKNSGFSDTQIATSLEEANKIKVEPSVEINNIDTSNAEEVNSFNTDTPVEVDEFGKSDVTTQDQGISKFDMGESSAINETNSKILADQKKAVDEEDNGAPTTTASDITTKAANSLEAWKKKQKTIDTKYEVSEKKSQNMLNEVKKVLEETDDEIDLEAVERMAKKTLGLKDGKEYDEDRTTAFWMALIKGGLATAAGESANALTNIAKGLSFGVDSYGKDMNSISDDEREDRKDLAKMKYELTKDEKNARIAKRTLKLQGYQTLASLEQQQNQFESKEDYQKQRDVITDAIASANLDLVAAQTFHKIGMDGATYDLKLKNFALDVKKQKQYIKLNNDKLNQDYKLGTMTTEMKNIYSLGDSYVTFDKDSKTYSYTPLGEQALIAATVSKTTITDLKTTAKQNAKSKEVFGNKYATEKEAESAYYKYEGQYKDRLTTIYKLKDNLGRNDAVGQAAALKTLQEEFGKASNSLTSVSTSSGKGGFKEGQKYTDKNGITKTYRNGKFE